MHKKWLCIICGYIYDEAKGWPNDGIAPGTPWEDIPDDWLCPDCGVTKSDFEMIELPEETQVAIKEPALISATNTPSQVTPSEPLADIEPIVIVGSGYAGYRLAAAIRERSSSQPIVVVTADDGKVYSKPSLSIALTMNKAPSELVSETIFEIEKRLNIRVYACCTLTKIDADDHQLYTNLGKLHYSKLILATGATQRNVPIAGDANQDVITVNDLQEYGTYRQYLKTAKTVVVIGDGLIGCEFANDLVNSGYEVCVVGLSDWPLMRFLPQEVGDLLKQTLAEKGVTWHLNTTVTEINHNADGYQVTLASGKLIYADLVVSATGLEVNTSLYQQAGIDCDIGIKVNAGMRTNKADIFALGDCCEINGQLMPYLAAINAATPALANCILGKPTMVQFPPMPITVKTSALPLVLLAPNGLQNGRWESKIIKGGAVSLYVNENQELTGFILAGKCVNKKQTLLGHINQIIEVKTILTELISS